MVWILVSLAAAFVVAVVILILATRARQQMRRRYAPPGRLIDVGGYHLHARWRGRQAPTVVIEAGPGDYSVSWMSLVDEIGEFARVFIYDRAGLGWSDESPFPRTLSCMVDELAAVLKHADVPGPYVMVGESLGAHIVGTYAQRYPERVAGLVLIDAEGGAAVAAALESENGNLAGANTPALPSVPDRLSVYELAVRSGLTALWPALLPDPVRPSRQLPHEERATHLALAASNPAYIRTLAAEVTQQAGAAADGSPPSPYRAANTPLYLLRSPEVGDGAMPPGATALRLSSPEVVINTIRDAVETARERQQPRARYQRIPPASPAPRYSVAAD